jgi:hypothetical protein
VNPSVRFDSDAANVINYLNGWIIPASVVALAAFARAVVKRFTQSPSAETQDWPCSRVIGNF